MAPSKKIGRPRELRAAPLPPALRDLVDTWSNRTKIGRGEQALAKILNTTTIPPKMLAAKMVDMAKDAGRYPPLASTANAARKEILGMNPHMRKQSQGSYYGRRVEPSEDADFDDFWRVLPCKRDKKGAWQLWVAMRHTLQMTPDEIAGNVKKLWHEEDSYNTKTTPPSAVMRAVALHRVIAEDWQTMDAIFYNYPESPHTRETFGRSAARSQMARLRVYLGLDLGDLEKLADSYRYDVDEYALSPDRIKGMQNFLSLGEMTRRLAAEGWTL